MPRRIDIELTSLKPDGAWTWRAVGARQPRGALDAAMAPADAAVGAQFRAEVESGIDGIDVIGLLPIKAPRSPEPAGRIEVVGTPRRGPDVSVSLVPGSRARRDRDDRGPRGEGRERGRPGGPSRPSDRRRSEGEGGRGPAGPRVQRPDGGDRPERGARSDRPERGPRAGGPTRDGDRRSEVPGRPKRPTVSTVHRNEVLASLRPEQLPVAEQLLRGGIPAVRQAIDEQNAAAKASGAPPASTEALLAMAEELLPTIRLAEWKDRATSAVSAGRDMRLRELRAVVAASRTVTLDDDGRALAKTLRDSLDARVTALRDEWIQRIDNALAEGRVLDALTATARPPEPGTRCPAELAVRLAESAGAAMRAEEDPATWRALLAAVVDSPVRRTVRPVGIPDDDEARSAALHAAGSVPELAKLLGLRIPPPPPRRTPSRRPLAPVPGRQAAAS